MFSWNTWSICVFLFIIFFTNVKSNDANSLRRNDKKLNFQKTKNIIKRGLSSSAGNDYGPPVHVSSDILQLDHSSNAGSDISKTFGNPWKGSNLSPGYELWLDSASGLANYQPVHAVTAAHIEHFGNTDLEHLGVFSTDPHGIGDGHLSGHSIAHVPSSTLDGHLSGVLHTQIISRSSSSSGGGVGDNVHAQAISGNIDFNSVADTKSPFPVKSYGR